VVEGDRVDVLVKDERRGNDKVEDIETLGAKVEWQNLNGVRNDERCKGDTRR
jgi:hypothetical protein